MKAVVITQPGGPEAMQIQERPRPDLEGEEVRVRVLVAGLNGADLLQRRGHYLPPPGAPHIPGLEIMGVVNTVGPNATIGRATPTLAKCCCR